MRSSKPLICSPVLRSSSSICWLWIKEIPSSGLLLTQVINFYVVVHWQNCVFCDDECCCCSLEPSVCLQQDAAESVQTVRSQLRVFAQADEQVEQSGPRSSSGEPPCPHHRWHQYPVGYSDSFHHTGRSRISASSFMLFLTSTYSRTSLCVTTIGCTDGASDMKGRRIIAWGSLFVLEYSFPTNKALFSWTWCNITLWFLSVLVGDDVLSLFRWTRAVRCGTCTDAEVGFTLILHLKTVNNSAKPTQFLLLSRKQYGAENVILSDIKKPPPHVFNSGTQNLFDPLYVWFHIQNLYFYDILFLYFRPICVCWCAGLQTPQRTDCQ